MLLYQNWMLYKENEGRKPRHMRCNGLCYLFASKSITLPQGPCSFFIRGVQQWKKSGGKPSPVTTNTSLGNQHPLAHLNVSPKLIFFLYTSKTPTFCLHYARDPCFCYLHKWLTFFSSCQAYGSVFPLYFPSNLLTHCLELTNPNNQPKNFQ